MPRMGRDRTKHRRYPLGWKLVNGTIYFVPTNAGDKDIVKRLTGKELSPKGSISMRLGKTHDEASATYAEKIVASRKKEDAAIPGTVRELCQLARERMLPTILNKDTNDQVARNIDALEALFGARRYAKNVYDASRDPTYLRALDIQKHLDSSNVPDEDGNTRHVAANREVKSWRQIFRDARIRWGLTEYNPCEGVVLNPEYARDVLPDADGLKKAYDGAPVFLQCMMDISRHYGRRRGEQLKLMMSDIKPDGLHFRRGKTRSGAPAKEIIIKWDPRLREIVERLEAWRSMKRKKNVSTMQLIVNQRGGPLTVTGYNSAWKRLVKKVGVKGDFTFHDIRALRATTLSQEKAVEVMAHEDPGTTNRIYRRGARVIDLNSENPPKLEENTG